MAAPKGNKFWTLRATHGRDKIFISPTILWEACKEYFEATDERKWVKKDWVGKNGIEVERENETPYTIFTLCTFLDITPSTWYEYAKKEDFSEICAKVMNIMTGQRVEGAMVGAFSQSLVARLDKLAEPTELSGNLNINMSIEPTAEEAAKIKAMIDKSI